jgi:hypothetical protein
VTGYPGTALVVDDHTDSLAGRVARQLTERRLPVRHLPASELGLVQLRIERDLAYVDGVRVCAVFFRAGPWSRFDDGFHADDASFVSMEVAAAWLAVLHNPSVATVNRLDAEAWTSRSEWPIWRRRLLAAGVPCVDVDVGAVDGDYAHWLPWGGGIAQPPGTASRRLFASALTSASGFKSVAWFGDRSFPASAAAREAGRVLRANGVELAGIVTDSADRVALCTARPEVDDETAEALAPDIAAWLAGALQVA